MKKYYIIPLVVVILLLAACGTDGKATPTQVSIAATQGSITDAATLPSATATDAAGPVVAPPVASNPDMDGVALLNERCTVCHSLTRVTSARKTAEDWTVIVNRMIGKGAQLNDTEMTFLVNYLAQTYHP